MDRPQPTKGVAIKKPSSTFLSGALVETISDPEDLDGVANSAIQGDSLYVSNARYAIDLPPPPDTPLPVTKLDIRPWEQDRDDA